MTSVFSLGASPVRGSLCISSPIVGAVRHSGSSSNPSTVMSVVIAVTLADLTESVEVVC